MDRKRALETGDRSSTPPAKHMRVPSSDGAGAAGDGEEEENDKPLNVFKRAQLAGKIADQQRELERARAKIDELHYSVSVLSAAPTSASYYMASCIEELGIALEHAGFVPEGGGEDESSPSGLNSVPASCRNLDAAPVAAALLDADLVTNSSLREKPNLLRKMVARVILAFENKIDGFQGRRGVDPSLPPTGDGEQNDRLNSELRRRLRVVSDQLERYADREQQNTVAIATLRDELDDLRALLDIRRRKIVALELLVRQLQGQGPDIAITSAAAAAAGADDDSAWQNHASLANGIAPGDEPTSSLQHDESGAVKIATTPGASSEHGLQPEFSDRADLSSSVPMKGSPEELQAALIRTRRLADQRLEELTAMHEMKKDLSSQVNSLITEATRRNEGIIPTKNVIASSAYQAMEANLQQLYLKERTWESERSAASQEREEEKRDLTEQLEHIKSKSHEEIEELKRQIEELRRTAESAKAEKDKWAMTYEARKIEANGAASLVEAAERRANGSEQMRNTLKASYQSLQKEADDLRKRVTESELRVIRDSTELPGADALARRLEADLATERAKCTSFIAEVESLSAMYSDLETENTRLDRLLAEKESVLSKVMSEKLRGRQNLATVKEEARTLAQGRELDQEKIKNLATQVTASRRAAHESLLSANKSCEEVRNLSAQLIQQKKIAEEAVVAARTAKSERDQMCKERDIAVTEAEKAKITGESNAFAVHRLSEEVEELKAVLSKETAKRANGGDEDHGKDALRDEIIQELMKKLHCSIVTNQPKEVALTRCGHMMSRQCVTELMARRSRKCPLCGTGFSESEILSVYLD